MKAVAYCACLPIDQAESLIDVEVPDPEPGPRDLLVEVRAISVNPVDVKRRARVDPGGRNTILGWDVAGVVRSTGAAVERFKPGDEVFYAGAIDRPGGNAQLHAVDERIVGHKPHSIGFAEAAALPLTTLTAWELLFDRFRVPYSTNETERNSAPAEVLLIVGGGGGVGSIAIQLARRLTNLRVIASASRPDTKAWVESLGAHDVVDHRQPLAEQVRKIAPGGANYVMGLTHTEDHFDELVELLAPESHLGLIDDPSAPLEVKKLKDKSAALHWEFMFTRARYETPTMGEQGRILDELAALVDAGVLRSTIRENFGPISAANLKRAHALVESGSSVGKVVLAGF